MGAKSFIKGATIGALFASAAALLLAPKSGKRTQKDVERLVGSVSKKISKEFEKISGMSKEQYQAIIKKSVAEFSKGKALAREHVDELMNLLNGRWQDVRKELNGTEEKKKKK
jgi:gas vesicle protein